MNQKQAWTTRADDSLTLSRNLLHSLTEPTQCVYRHHALLFRVWSELHFKSQPNPHALQSLFDRGLYDAM